MQSTPRYALPSLTCAALTAATVSIAERPEFSARALGRGRGRVRARVRGRVRLG